MRHLKVICDNRSHCKSILCTDTRSAIAGQDLKGLIGAKRVRVMSIGHHWSDLVSVVQTNCQENVDLMDVVEETSEHPH